MSALKRRGETPDEAIPSKRAKVDGGARERNAEQDAAPLQFDLYRTLMKVTDGSGEHRLCCHRELLHFKAPKLYRKIAKRLELSQKERGRSVQLALNGRALHMFLQWLYTGRITALPPSFRVGDLQTQDDTRLFRAASVNAAQSSELIVESDMVELSAFAKTWDIPHLRNCSSDVLVAACLQSGTSLSAKVIRAAYERKLGEISKFACLHAWALCPQTPYSPRLEDLPVRHLIAVINKFASRQKRPKHPNWSLANPCEFHKHPYNEMGNWCRGIKPFNMPLASAHTCLVESFGDTVKILVGGEEIPFDVHRQLLCHFSTYFEGAFNSKFQEARERQARLPETTPETFRIFLRWMYTGIITPLPTILNPAEVPTRPGEPHPSMAVPRSGVSEKFPPDESGQVDIDIELNSLLQVAYLYVFADAQDVRELRNEVLTTFIGHWELKGSWLQPHRKLVTYVFDSVAVDCARCPLKKFLIAEAAYCWSHAEVSSSANSCLPSEFLAGVMRAQAKKTKTGKPRKENLPWRTKLCRFHEHRGEHENRWCKEKNADLRSVLKKKNEASKEKG